MNDINPETLVTHTGEAVPAPSSISLGDFLKARRAELDRSQRQMGLPSAHISQLETGNITNVTPTTLLRITGAYEVSLTECIDAGVEMDENLINSTRALMVGEAIMALPDSEQEEILDHLNLDRY